MATASHPYEFKLIKAKEINVDPTYQRKEKKPMVKEIVRNFDYHKVNPVKVVLRNDRQYYAFDGQQTTIGLRSKFGDSYLVPCMVYYDVPTWADEAELFEETNLKKAKCPVTTNELWKSRLMRGEEKATKIQRIAERYGLIVRANCSGDSRGQIKALNALDRLFDNLGEKDFEEMISIIAAAWNGDPVSLSAPILNGMALFVKAFRGEYDRSRLIKKLKNNAPQVIVQAGKASNATGNKKYAREILAIYNSYMKTGHLNENKL